MGAGVLLVLLLAMSGCQAYDSAEDEEEENQEYGEEDASYEADIYADGVEAAGSEGEEEDEEKESEEAEGRRHGGRGDFEEEEEEEEGGEEEENQLDESNEAKQEEEDQDDERTGESDEEQKKSGKKGRNVEREEEDEKVTNMESGGNETEEEYDQENSSEDAEDGKEEEEEEEESPEDKEEEEEGNGSGKGSRFWPFSKDSEDEKRLPSSVPDVEPETCPSVGYCMAVCYEFSPEENRRRRRHMLPFAPEVEEKKEELVREKMEEETKTALFESGEGNGEKRRKKKPKKRKRRKRKKKRKKRKKKKTQKKKKKKRRRKKKAGKMRRRKKKKRSANASNANFDADDSRHLLAEIGKRKKKDDDDGVSNQIKTLATEYKLSLHRPKRTANTAAYRSKRQSSGRSRRRRSGDRAPPPVKVELARNGEDETDLSGEGTSIEKVGVEVTPYGRFYPLGDMLLSPAQRKAAEDVGKGGLLTRAASNSIVKWENGVIPYKFEPSYDRYPRKKAAILKLIAVMNKLLDGCLNFVPHAPWNDHFMSFDHGSGQIGPCSSPIGRSSRGNLIKISPRATRGGCILHEVFHSLGFVHEFMRPDRELFVDVKLGAGRAVNFQRKEMDEVDLLDEPYDLYSIMHYQLDRSGLTLRSQRSEVNKDLIGRTVYPSVTDLAKLRKLYDCEEPRLPRCPREFVKSHSLCYHAVRADGLASMFSEADKFCRSMAPGEGSRLYEPRDFRSFWKLMKRFMKERPDVHRYWVGILDVKSEEGGEPYYLSDDLPTAFNQFLLHHLNKHKLEEPCVMINLMPGARTVSKAKLEFSPCDRPLPFVCEVPQDMK